MRGDLIVLGALNLMLIPELRRRQSIFIITIASEPMKSIERDDINHQAVNSHWASALLEFPLLQ